jgi:hypothetical protein
MNKADIVKQVKALFNVEVEVEDKPVLEVEKENMMAEAVLKGGVKIMTPDDEFKVGSEVFVVGEDGENVLAPDAEHELEDGTIVVTVEGKITEIKEVELEDEVELGDKEKMISFEEFKKLNEKVIELEKKLNEKEEKFNKVKEATILMAEEFSKLPGGENIVVEKTGLKEENRKAHTKEQKFMNLLKSIRN